MISNFRKKLLIICVLLLAFLGVLALIVLNDTKSETRETGDLFIRAITDRDYNTSYNMLDNSILSVFIEIEDWASWVNFTFENQQGQAEFINETTVEYGNVFTAEQQPTLLTYRFTIDNVNYNLPILITKNEDNTWKVSEIGIFEQQ